MIYETEIVGRRQPRKKIKVTLGDGRVICYKNATVTFLETLKCFDPAELSRVGLEISHRPIFSKVAYTDMAEYMKPINDGWLVNTRSDSSQKYLQLKILNESLGLGLIVEMAEEMDGMESVHRGRSRHKDSYMIFIGSDKLVYNRLNNHYFIEVIGHLNTEMLARKSFEMFGKEIVTRFKKYPKQEQLPNGLWVTTPKNTKDAIRIFSSLNEKFGCGIEWIDTENREALIKRLERFIHENLNNEAEPTK